MTNKSTRTLIWILLAIILVLLLFVGYFFLLKPAITGYTVNQQTLGYNYAYQEVLTSLIGQLQENGYVQLPYGNQTIILAPVQQQAAPAQ
jgi:hypothetical protein